MSKRYIHAQQQSERKKARLDISISDHNFPLSQNSESNKDCNDADNWGDDNDDEILLLASQACEEAYNDSQLPDYSLCMQPPSTSTQYTPQPGPSSSKSDFTFKKPSSKPPNAITTNLKEKCNRISSPLPGISSKMISKANGVINPPDDLIFNDKVFKNQDSDYVYKQLLQLQEENVKLMSENGKLLEKCVTKEGEASILRTQLKTCQVAVDNARLEKIRAQEKVQMEWTEKLVAANSQMHDLRTQLDFKNLEIISIKEKCKKLESSKVKLTQVTVGVNDLSNSYKNNNSILLNDNTVHSKRVKTASSGVQTNDKAHFLKLNKICRTVRTPLASILPQILEPTIDQHHSILDYNEKLQTRTDLTQNKCRVYSTFHRVPSTSVLKEVSKCKVTLGSLYGDVMRLATSRDDMELQDNYCSVFNTVSSVLNEVQNKLETVSHRVTSSFQKEMDERYIDVTSNYTEVGREDLLRAGSLYKEEQDILARRTVATLSYVLDTSRGLEAFCKYDRKDSAQCDSTKQCTGQITNTVNRICVLLDNTCCATLYSGLLLSISYLTQLLISVEQYRQIVVQLLRTMLASRPMPFVVTKLLDIARTVSLWDRFLPAFCPGNSTGNLRTDYDQGVLLYKKDSCFVQVLLKQVEACLKCIEKQNLVCRAIETSRSLIVLHSNICDGSSLDRNKTRCDCALVLIQVTVYALRICAVMLDSRRISFNDAQGSECKDNKELLSLCRCGVRLLYQGGISSAEFSSQLGHYEGHLLEFCELLKTFDHTDAYANMLSELSGTLQSSPEDMPPSFHRQPWLKSFQCFSLAD